MVCRLVRDQEAVSQTVGFTIATVLFIASLGTVYLATNDVVDPGDVQAADEARLDIQSRLLADMILTEGIAQDGTPWDGSTDTPLRLGLLGPDGRFDYDKWTNLNQAPLAAESDDGLVSYDEALAAFATDGLGFHVRAYPTLESTQEMLEELERFNQDLGVAYVGALQPIDDSPHVRICTLLLDEEGDPVDGTGYVPDGTVFSIPSAATPDGYTAAGVLPTTQHETPLTLDVDVLGNGSPDAECTTYSSLPLGGYFYGEAGSTAGTWFEVLYNDFHTATAETEDDFYPYSGELFDADSDNDEERDTNSDGHLILNTGRPHRTIVVVHRVDPGDDTDRMVICHHPGERSEKTKSIPVNAWPAHEGHGDTEGACTGGDSCTGDDCGGDDDIDASGVLGTPTCTADGDVFTVLVPVTNTGGNTTQFHAVLELDDHSEKGNTHLVDPGASTEFRFLVPAFDEELCEEVEVAVHDPVRFLDSVEVELDVEADDEADDGLWLDTTRPWFLTGEDVRFAYGGEGMKNKDDLRIVVHEGDSDAATVVYDTGTFEAGNPVSRERNVGALAAGAYLAVLTGNGYTTHERVLVVDEDPDPFTSITEEDEGEPEPPAPTTYPYPVSANANKEVEYLEDLFASFCPYYHDSTTLAAMEGAPAHADRCGATPGDVFTATTETLFDALPSRLEGADAPDVLFVGSDVTHTLLADYDAKRRIADWVEAGGHLVVLGSDAQNVVWLDEVFESAIASSSGGIAAPDEAHPLLRTPNVLEYHEYAEPTTAWDLGDASGHFTVVLDQSGSGAAMAVSDPGAFGQGRVVVTSHRAYDLLGEAGALQDLRAKEFLMNLALIGLQDLYLDYGPEIPAGAPAYPSVRSGTILHPLLGDVHITVQVFVFPA